MRKFMVGLSLLIVSIAPSMAQIPPAPSDVDAMKEAIVQMLDVYVNAYSRDANAIADLAAVPLVAFGAQRTFILNSREDVEKLYGNALSGLKARGYSHSKWADVYVRPLTPATALISAVAIRYTNNDAEMERIGITYFVRRVDGAWKLAVVSASDPRRAFRAD